MNAITVQLTTDGHLTIPPELLASAKLQPGEVHLEVADTGLLIRPFFEQRPVDLERMRRVVGCAKDKMPGVSSRQWLDETRGPVELPPED